MEQFQIARMHGHRANGAWWNCIKTDLDWTVRFHADFVPSETFKCRTIEYLLFKVLQMEEKWRTVVDERINSND